ncbi:VWA domain-containing protein [Actinosynnema sp. NPDC050436]|uniref:VWA domain-containing protein n=1 Tax=Actinosynnema sp. NPDC050436 TaxID=3155659 RepID=UPI0034113DCA
MPDRPEFELLVTQNPYLSPAEDEVHAALVVRARVPEAAGALPDVAQVIVVDCSGSMSYPANKISAARQGTRAAIGALRDGALFAVVAGTERARQVYPAQGLATANPKTRKEARAAVRKLTASGGTAIGRWLALAGRLLREHPDAVRHVILLTDGQNGEPAEELDRVLDEHRADFSCDARGIGTDWLPSELVRIAEAMNGTADAIRRPDDLVDDFAAMTRTAMAKHVPELRILVSTTAGARLGFLRQTHPAEADLVGVPLDERTTAFPTGSWGAETREYHLRLALDRADDAERGTDLRVARIDLEMRPPEHAGHVKAGRPKAVIVHYTDESALSSRVDPALAHYAGQAELARAVMEGYDAHGCGDLAGAAARWGRAVVLATGLGNDEVLTQLLRLVDVVGEPGDGVVRVKQDLAVEDLLRIAVISRQSSVSVYGSSVQEEPRTVERVPEGPAVRCGSCGREWPAGARFCGDCGRPIMV